MLLCVVPLAVSEARLVLRNFDNITIRIANVAERLAGILLWLCNKHGSSISPLFIVRLNIWNADMHKAADWVRIGGNTERYRWFCGCRAAPDVDNEPHVSDLDVPGRAAAVASAQNATSE